MKFQHLLSLYIDDKCPNYYDELVDLKLEKKLSCESRPDVSFLVAF